MDVAQTVLVTHLFKTQYIRRHYISPNRREFGDKFFKEIEGLVIVLKT